MRKIKVGIIQQNNTADLRQNLMNLAKNIEACAAHGAQLVVLQELHNSLYFCQTEDTDFFDLAEPIPGPSYRFLFRVGSSSPHCACYFLI
ncbi:hydrolase, carbon-nitrogen family [gut metagenome]|uniref:Hydrolase, carbon-nitrogen family n=1 Tax=gut metagenome TaxID=749906 RepID=J9GDD5_9ZZZZ